MAAVRDWTVGDFARQRTEGRAGTGTWQASAPSKGLRPEAEIRLHDPEKKAWITPTAEDRPRLVGYRTSGTPQSVAVEMVLPLTFAVSDHTAVLHELDVVHAMKPFPPGTTGDWDRADDHDHRPRRRRPEGTDPVLRPPDEVDGQAGRTIHVLENGEPIDLEGRAAHPLTKQENGDYRATIRYTFRTPSSPTVLPRLRLLLRSPRTAGDDAGGL